MGTQYFGSETGRSSQLPFFSDWWDNLSDEQKKFYEGWKFVVFDFRIQKTSNKGWFMDTLKFTTFLFKSHPFVKMMEKDEFCIEQRNKAFCVEIDSTEKWFYKYCLVDVPYAEWEVGAEDDFGVICKGLFISEEKIIINGLPDNVPSSTPKRTRKKSTRDPRG